MQTDGNAVVYNSQSWALWATNTGGLIQPGAFTMRADGDLVLYDIAGQPHWASNTAGNPGAFLNVQDDGNIVVYRAGSTTETPDNALWSAGSNDVQTILEAHNGYRAQVGVPPLQWSSELAGQAQSWANQLAATSSLGNERGIPFGQNAISYHPNKGDSYPQALDAWGSEQQDYIPGIFPDVSRTGSIAAVGQYTQMVWRNTTEVGCAVAGDQYYAVLVCFYNPPGNIFGETVF
jgi:hypothetical protein